MAHFSEKSTVNISLGVRQNLHPLTKEFSCFRALEYTLQTKAVYCYFLTVFDFRVALNILYSNALLVYGV